MAVLALAEEYELAEYYESQSAIAREARQLLIDLVSRWAVQQACVTVT